MSKRLRLRHQIIHGYADDTQLYPSARRDDMTSTVHRFEGCITDVSHWMSANWLKLNTGKSELLWSGSRHSLSSLTGCGPSLQLGADTVTAQDDVRLPGVTISLDLSLQRHVSNVSATSLQRSALLAVHRSDRCICHGRVCPSVRPTRHILVFCRDEWSYDHAVITVR